MTDREKLIELLDEATEKIKDLCGGLNNHHGNDIRADHLIANGVTFATDNNVGDKMSPTNADRIRAMSDEELAKFIPDWSYTPACKCDEKLYVDCNNECDKCVLEWLKQPAEVDHE